jgi:hypothetical protein
MDDGSVDGRWSNEHQNWAPGKLCNCTQQSIKLEVGERGDLVLVDHNIAIIGFNNIAISDAPMSMADDSNIICHTEDIRNCK